MPLYKKYYKRSIEFYLHNGVELTKNQKRKLLQSCKSRCESIINAEEFNISKFTKLSRQVSTP